MKQVLKEMGLTDNEVKVYVFLAKSGTQKPPTIAEQLRMHKAQAYRILKTLQSKGVVESSLERPMRFNVIPFERVLDLGIKIKRDEARLLEERKSELLAHWSSIDIEERTSPMRKFVVIQGRSNIYSKLMQMIEDVEEEVLAVTTSSSISRADQAGIVRIIEERGVLGRFLTYISQENIELIQTILINTNMKGRHLEAALRGYPRFFVKDSDEAIFFITLKEDPSLFAKEVTGLWTNSEMVIYAKTFFEELWSKAMDIDEKIQMIKSG